MTSPQLGFSFFTTEQPQPVQTDRQRPRRIAPQPESLQEDLLQRGRVPTIAVCEPITTEEAIEKYRALIEQHHAAMLTADAELVKQLRDKACNLAARMNGGTSFGILADDDAPGCVLERETAAPAGTVPLWGQIGEFVITVDGMRVKIETEGMFSISSGMFWLGFSAHAVDWNKPFISETGYRSFLGLLASPAPGMTPDTFTTEVIRTHVAKEMKGKLRRIDSEYVERAGDKA